MGPVPPAQAAEPVASENPTVTSEGQSGRAGGAQKDLPSKLRTIAAEHPDARLQLWCQDKARFGQKGQTTRVWHERGVRPPGVVDRRFESLYLFAACRPRTEEAFALALPRVNADAMTVFLEHFSRQLAPGVHAVLILDQAGWHDPRALHVPETITLLPLPSASPELNPVERIWLYPHRVLGDYDAVLDAVCRAWNRLLDETGRLTSLTAYPYLTASGIP
ncbi:IS630 family transposase [Microvirga sp. KLBC 81]|uniref:IS630 family transposase n=1 Tax=Microvirga sp. KLBC 81 TaxID=1862707 RepID=UPI000D5172D5|nr:IS630 family transposase [Microvirga sp. KLBC 81]PVE21795.1 IS630 family transposase [Microvirga sp. KLBC 81]